VRLFIASKAVLLDYAQLREDFEGIVSGKWVEEENLHLTWYFAGEVADPMPLLEKLSQIPPLSSPIPLKGLGIFGRRHKILHVEARDKRLYKKASEFKKAGFEIGRFHPHVTLCRIKRIHDKEAFWQKMKEYRHRKLGEITQVIALYESTLTQKGPIYRRIEMEYAKMVATIEKEERISMQIKMQPMGPYQTNCYIVTIDGKDFIIDPGMGATEWVLQNAKKPVAILNTHGHFDHVWSNAELREKLKVPIYAPEGDLFMLEDDPLGQGTPPSHADYAVKGDETLEIAGEKIRYRHFPGHTPGCSVIEIGDNWFSGDFLFQQSIGRWDFPASSGEEMLKSLQKAQQIEGDYTIYPGHGPATTLKAEQKVMPYWIEQVKRSL
jgi:2'-5' RNA ligase